MILAIYDIFEQSWTVAGEGYEILAYITSDNASIFKPDDFRFGWTVTVNEKQTDNIFYPPVNGKFVEIRSTARFYGRVNALPDDQVTVTFFSFEKGAKTEKKHKFIMPRPESPFSSWDWVDGAWTPPSPYPEDGNLYIWDEESLSWTDFPKE